MTLLKLAQSIKGIHTRKTEYFDACEFEVSGFINGLIFGKKITKYQSYLILQYLFPGGKNYEEKNKNFEFAKNKLIKINYKK